MSLPEEVKLFLIESYENLDKAEQELLVLERQPGDADYINRIFRTVHTIKGNAGFLGYSNLETLCHRGEALLDKLRSKQIAFSQDIGSILLEFFDVVRVHLGSIESTGREDQSPRLELIAKLDGR